VPSGDLATPSSGGDERDTELENLMTGNCKMLEQCRYEENR
jgi:hypothetical protein